MAFRQLIITRVAAAGTSLSPLPCHAWRGYMVTNAHRVEVEVGADGPASAPPTGSPPLRRRRAPTYVEVLVVPLFGPFCRSKSATCRMSTSKDGVRGCRAVGALGRQE
jgi:hypothetical protein